MIKDATTSSAADAAASRAVTWRGFCDPGI